MLAQSGLLPLQHGPNVISSSDIGPLSVSDTTKNAPVQQMSVPADTIICACCNYMMQGVIGSLMNSIVKQRVKLLPKDFIYA